MNDRNAIQSDGDIRRNVREHYANAVESKPAKTSGGCCCSPSSTPCCGETLEIYEDVNVATLPEDVTNISLGCGDPVTLAALKPGQVVLDLGSGGGIDCFLAAKKVGSTGRVIGVDMTPQMIDRARANKEKLGIDNVEFRLGEIEHLPVENGVVDVVISNCVINLSPDKPQVFKEIFRVLKPGGKLAVSDIVTDGDLPAEIKGSLAAWAGCISGAVQVEEYKESIAQAGFKQVKVIPVYFSDEMTEEAFGQLAEIGVSGLDRDALSKTIFSAKITAEKP